MTVCYIPVHAECHSYHAGTIVIVSDGGRNATVHDPKPKQNAQAQQSQKWTQYDANNKQFRPLFPDKVFSLTLP